MRFAARTLLVLVFFLAATLAPAIPWTWPLAGLLVATVGLVGWHAWVRLGRDLDDAIEDLNADIDRQRVAYHCAAHGHAFCHPELHNGQRVWRCENCGDAVVSGPGWVDGESA